MKFGFNLLLWATHITEDQFHLIETLKKTGYDGVEIPIFEGDPAHFAKIGKAAKENGLGVTSVTIMPDTEHNGISADPASRKGALDHLKWAIDCTEAMGGEVLAGPIHQTLGHFTGRGRTDEEWDYGIETLQAAADYAARANVALSVEPLNRFECYFLNLAGDAAAFTRAVGRPNIGYLYDTFHANIEEKDPVGAIGATFAQINHVHTSATDRGTPGKDHAPWAETFSALKSRGYDRWVVIEAFGRALPDLAAATRVWRDFFPAREEVYTFGHDFIRKGWEEA